ncbi:NADPH-dependent F420 reductase [Lacticaseibacillus kribbianus]|uniref:NADPH-dependent F420 reductase n=1 Tax=Lacticaseibacillus kribbianus TaxID=2926292 RepID=UPI001CD33E30|nr:NAD(P)-binding domain-containing protein [Lacticaseibacillus kribbianus]
MTRPVIGILGAGKLGTTLARLSVHAGYPTLIGSRKPVADLKWVVDVLAPGAETVTAAELTDRADIVILAIPLSQIPALDPTDFAGKIVLDAANYWADVDGSTNTFSSLTEGSSEVTQRLLSQSLVAKAFNHMGYHDLEIEVTRHPSARSAMAFATDHDAIRPAVTELITALGFAPLDLGPLRFGLLLEPGSPLFGLAEPVPAFKEALANVYDSPFGRHIIAARGGKIQ